MQILVVNSGSSSIKLRLVDVAENAAQRTPASQDPLLKVSINGIGGIATFESMGRIASPATDRLEIRDHAHAFRILFKRLAGALNGIEAVGHRVVHLHHERGLAARHAPGVTRPRPISFAEVVP